MTAISIIFRIIVLLTSDRKTANKLCNFSKRKHLCTGIKFKENFRIFKNYLVCKVGLQNIKRIVPSLVVDFPFEKYSCTKNRTLDEKYNEKKNWEKIDEKQIDEKYFGKKAKHQLKF